MLTWLCAVGRGANFIWNCKRHHYLNSHDSLCQTPTSVLDFFTYICVAIDSTMIIKTIHSSYTAWCISSYWLTNLYNYLFIMCIINKYLTSTVFMVHSDSNCATAQTGHSSFWLSGYTFALCFQSTQQVKCLLFKWTNCCSPVCPVMLIPSTLISAGVMVNTHKGRNRFREEVKMPTKLFWITRYTVFYWLSLLAVNLFLYFLLSHPVFQP